MKKEEKLMELIGQVSPALIDKTLPKTEQDLSADPLRTDLPAADPQPAEHRGISILRISLAAAVTGLFVAAGVILISHMNKVRSQEIIPGAAVISDTEPAASVTTEISAESAAYVTGTTAIGSAEQASVIGSTPQTSVSAAVDPITSTSTSHPVLKTLESQMTTTACPVADPPDSFSDSELNACLQAITEEMQNGMEIVGAYVSQKMNRVVLTCEDAEKEARVKSQLAERCFNMEMIVFGANEKPPTVMSKSPAVEVVSVTADRTGCTVQLTNTTGQDSWYGVAFHIEKDGIDLPPGKENLTWFEISYELPAGQTQEMKLDWSRFYGALSPGTYMLYMDSPVFQGSPAELIIP